MKLSARNQLKGKILDVTKGATTSHVRVDLGHGIAVTADQKTLLVNSRLNSSLYAYSLPDLALRGTAKLGGKGAGWLVVTPDSKTAYVANEHTNNVSVVDVASMKETTLVPVGFAPARNAVWMAP